jgi:transcriptional regulator with XRE-family HTH domain
MTMSKSRERYASIAGSAFRTLNSIQEEMTRPEKFSKNFNPIARRLALTRELLGLAEKEFAEWAGVTLSRYHLWETGRIPISLSSAIALCAAHGLTLDWLYRGKILGLPLRLAIEVEACSARLGADNEFHNKANHPEDGRDRLTWILQRRPKEAGDGTPARRARLRTEKGGDVRKSPR